MLKLNPVALAAERAIQVVEFDAIQREAAMKIPIKEATREVARRLLADLDAALQLAVERYLGQPLTDPETLRGRLTNATYEGEEGETYCVDGVPVLWAGPASIVRDGDSVRGNRQLRQLEPTPKSNETS